ncbi:AAA family ATPase [Alkalimarinus alittae]|uniref:AAA family ATPase n=1 Tax=Alkalimarinus alittae TaxID=2961619 RepID=A0ABY6N2C9_9ALTE|nr:AAA family ATPase [Alkalimarinus alittae]UZE96190.1 AAA family ATPase [Alkalimarinus alittae]
MSSDTRTNTTDSPLSSPDVYCPVLMIASPGPGHGKTMLSALVARLHLNKGRKVQVFKAGSDLSDHTVLECASGQKVLSIDLLTMSELAIKRVLYHAAYESDLIIIECAKGLFDGQARGSHADLARLLGVPIVVVIDAQGINQTFGAIAHGMQSFQPDLPFGGVIANGMSNVDHFQRIKQGTPARVPLIAGIPRDKKLALPARYLASIQPRDCHDLDRWLEEAIDTLISSRFTAGIERLPEAICFSLPRSTQFGCRDF